MNPNLSLTPSELMYLFLDGEADSAQRTTLMNHLAQDGALQQEFQDALKMRVAVQHVALRTTPPVALTQQLFARAGFSGAAASGLGAATGAATVARPIISEAVRTGIFKTVLIPLASAVVGSLLTATVLLNRTPATDSVQPGTPIVQSYAAANSVASNASATSFLNAPATTPEQIAPSAPTRVDHGSRTPQTQRADLAGAPVSGSISSQTSVGSLSDTTQSAISTHSEIAARSNAPVAGTVATANPATARVQSLAVPLAETKYVMQSTIAPMIEFRDGPQFPVTTQNEEREWTVTLRGISTLRQFPSRQFTDDDYTIANNIGGGALYHYAPNKSVGLEIGEEQFPLYVSDNNGHFGKQESLFWIGAAFRYTADPIRSLNNVRPFGQLVLGGTYAGPMGKSILGVEWNFDPRVSMTAGVEGTFLVHKYAGMLSGAEKLGLTYGFAVQF